MNIDYKESFIDIYTNNIKRDGSKELLEFLEKSDFFIAPASTQFHSNFQGGLCSHSINVYNRFLKMIKLEYGEDYDVTVYVFKKSCFKKIIRTEWSLQELVNKINTGKCKLEFLYQYIDYNSRIVECELKFDKNPYRQECIMKISAPRVDYYWNNLRKDRPW